jgi:4a-hydroxytetrahydrobiopterin dehydratase
MEQLSPDQISQEIASLSGWQLQDGTKILKVFRFRSFPEAFALLTAVAIEAEKMNHHPEMRNVYAMDEFTLTTHDAGGLTHLDFALARKIDALAYGAIQNAVE